MMRGLRKITSLNNLRAKGALSMPRKGQIATLLILMMVAVLILIMVTVNIGQASLTATNMANAADSGALYLASQLATQAQFMWRYLGDGTPTGGRTQHCKKVGMASVVFAAIAAIFVSIITAGTGADPAWTMFWATVAGAAGGAAGGEYAGTGAGAGFWQGMSIGMSIGMGVAGGIQPAQLPASAAPFAADTVGVTSSALAVSTYSLAQGVTGAGLAVGANTYSSYIGQQMTQNAYIAASQSLNGLNEYDRCRESVFLQVFLQTVDDPAEKIDVDDVDDDGEKADKVLPFFYWWKDRVKVLKEAVKAITPFAERFFHDLDDFVQDISVDECTAWYTDEDRGWKEVCLSKNRCYLNLLSSKKKTYKKESIREMAGNIQTGLGSEFCVFYPDSIDRVFEELQDFSGTGDLLLTQLENYGLNQLIATWNSWFPMFYDVDARKGLYYDLGKLLNGDSASAGFYGLREWLEQLDEAEKKIKDEYPECEKYCPVEWDEGRKYIDYSKCTYTNSPCHTAEGGCSADSDLVDEIVEARAAIEKIIEGVEAFRTTINYCYYYTASTYKNAALNPATYSWKDSRGDLSVTVEAGPYRLARIVPSRHGGMLNKKVCATLVDYDDAGNCWIKVSRKEPANSKDFGILGKWRPAAGGATDFTISRTSKAYYSFDKVGLSGVGK